jgi:hypothetical protein
MTTEPSTEPDGLCEHGNLIGWHCAGCKWGCGNDDHEEAAVCICTDWCGESSEAGCCYCVHSDPYAPCPKGGYWCDGPAPCDCCSIKEQAFVAAARARIDARESS